MKRKQGTKFVLLCCLMILLTGCTASQQTIREENKETETVIPVMFRINPSTNQEQYKDIVEGFNTLYKGQYHIDVEWVTATEQGYREKIKVLNALDELPAVITDVAFSVELYKSMADNGRFIDLKSYMEQSEEWSQLLTDTTMESLLWENGEIYLSPVFSGLYSSAGIFYNKDLFAKAGIKEFPQTWEDFFLCLKKLQKAGVEPLALNGGETYWEAMLFATAYMASEPAGKEFLMEVLPDSYCNKEMDRLLKCIKLLYNYTYPDALELKITDAAERFYNGEAAMLANGFWTFDDMPIEAQRYIEFAPFPGNTMMVSREMSSWTVISGYEEEVTKGAVEFLKYRYLHSQAEARSILEMEYKSIYSKISNSFPNYQLKWKDRIQNDFFSQMIPKLLNGEITRKEFLRQMEEQ